MLGGFDSFFGPMRTQENLTKPPDMELVVHGPGEVDSAVVFSQTYKGGSWQLGTDRLGLPCRVTARADRLGRMMIAQAGVGSLLRYVLGQQGLAWLHAATLVRGDEALVLAGPSGIGKSQIVLRAVRDGWRYITDDHTLVGVGGLTGVTTPILLRGYGSWPDGLNEPAPLRRTRLAHRMLRCATIGQVNLMSPYTPDTHAVLASPAPKRYATHVCYLEPGAVVSVVSGQYEAVLENLAQGMRRSGHFLDDLVAGRQTDKPLIDIEAFWVQQRQILTRWLSLSNCDCSRARMPRPMDEPAYRRLMSLLAAGSEYAR